MTREEAIIILQEALRQNKVIQESPNTFFQSADIADGMKNAERRIAALNMAVAALHTQPDTPPNDPLTPEQLDELDQEPIWVVRGDGEGRWALARFANKYGVATHGCGFLAFEDWQVDWWAYRRKPEEV